MIFLIVCLTFAAALIALHLAMPRHPQIYCALYGHDPELGEVKIASDLRWYCGRCKREVGPL